MARKKEQNPGFMVSGAQCASACLLVLQKPHPLLWPLLRQRSPDLHQAYSRRGTGTATLGPRRNSLRARLPDGEEAEWPVPFGLAPLAPHPLAGWPAEAGASLEHAALPPATPHLDTLRVGHHLSQWLTADLLG